MKISMVLSGPPIWWKVRKDSPAVLDIFLDQYKIVNPILVRHTLTQNSISSRQTIIYDSEIDIIFSSSEIGLIKIEKSRVETDPDTLVNLASNFLSWVRYLSFQIEIPSVPTIYVVSPSVEVSDDLPKTDFSEANLDGYIRSNIINNSVSESIIRQSAYNATVGESVPTHYKFLLDAYANYKAEDYKQCYLDLAISTEVYINIKMEQEYENKLSQKIVPEMRIIEIPQAGGVSIRKDPIYEMLIGKTDFSTLLHELPLYLLGRSIMIDIPEVYRTALILYRTRNKIVHKGEPNKNESSKYFSMTSEDAQKALKCVEDIYRWFGDNFTYPTEGLVPYMAADPANNANN